MQTAIPIILFTVLTNAIAQIFLKTGMARLGEISLTERSILSTTFGVVFSPYVFVGLCIFVISMISHLYALSRVDVSFAYPFLSLAYVVVLTYAYFFLHEDVNLYRVAGVSLICVGTLFVAQS